MEGHFLAWNIENWITVLLMAAAGYLVFLLIVQAVKQYSPQKAAA